MHCDPHKPGVIEVRIARTPREMHQDILAWTHEIPDPDVAGQLTSYHSKKIGRGRPRMRSNFVVGRMFLNAHDLRDRPNETISHECTHAGMAWARLRRANLDRMVGEEVLCHAVGRLVKQVVRVVRAAQVLE